MAIRPWFAATIAGGTIAIVPYIGALGHIRLTLKPGSVGTTDPKNDSFFPGTHCTVMDCRMYCTNAAVTRSATPG